MLFLKRSARRDRRKRIPPTPRRGEVIAFADADEILPGAEAPEKNARLLLEQRAAGESGFFEYCPESAGPEKSEKQRSAA